MRNIIFCMFLWGTFSQYPEVIVYIAIFVIWTVAWKRTRETVSIDVKTATVAIKSGLTATSILLPATFLIRFVGQIPETVMPYMVASVMWFVWSIMVGTFNLSRLPTMVVGESMKDKVTPILGAMQLFAIILGTVRLFLVFIYI